MLSGAGEAPRAGGAAASAAALGGGAVALDAVSTVAAGDVELDVELDLEVQVRRA
jgi:hypothetical protein